MPDLDAQTAFAINAEARRIALDDAVEAVKKELLKWINTTPIGVNNDAVEALTSSIKRIQDLKNA